LWIGYDPIYVARKLELFGEEEIQLVQFTTASESVRAYQNGLIDVAALTGDEVLRVCATMGPQAVFLVCDWSSGADCILGQPEIRSMSQLAGLRVGLETTALGAYMIHRASKEKGMVIADFELVHVPLLEHSDAFLQRKVDAIVTFEPHKTRLIAAGANKLFDSQDIPGEVIDVLITKPPVLRHKKEQLQLLVDSWFEGVDAILSRDHDVQEYLAASQGVDVQTIDSLLRGIVLTDRSQNVRILGAESSQLLSTFGKVQKFMLDGNLVPQLDYMPYIYSDFL
jgi:NitT/TauT family transport system substrate-binding protein